MTPVRLFISHINLETDLALNTCQALFLAARVAPIANMVATHVEISGEAAARWADCFYEMLTDGFSVYEAFELTRSNVDDVRMALIRHDDFSVARRKIGSEPMARMGNFGGERRDEAKLSLR